LRYVQEATIAVAQVASARLVLFFPCRGKTDGKVDMNVSPELSDGDYADALTGKNVQVKDGKMEFTLPAQTAAFVTKP
jgi:hypothetical protein